MQRIGEVSAKYDISNRTLHYWEESGIIKSCRMENGYRYYDDYNVARIKQIIMLRKLNLPIQGIHRIFASGELSVVVEILTNHLEQTNHKADELRALSIVLERLIQIVKDQEDAGQIFKYLDVPENSAILKLKDALQIVLSERNNDMSENTAYGNNDVRIVSLPRMIFAGYGVVSDTPEDDCWEKIRGLIDEYFLDHEPGFRNFGFGFNNENGEYGYEMLVTVPESFEVHQPFVRKEFNGGLFAALPAYLTIIGERWDQLSEWLRGSEDYELDWNPELLRDCLEECIDYKTFSSKETENSKRQLDLLLPIKRIDKDEEDNSINEVISELEPKEVTLPDITLAGCLCEFGGKKLPWKKSVPWYKLAQAIYKTGKDFGNRMIEGNNTFTLVFGDVDLPFPFYALGKSGFVVSVFAAVQIAKSFESYPVGLEERVLPSRKYLLFNTWIRPEIVTTKKLPLQKLYNAAAEYIQRNNIKADFEYCLERDYRKDGRNTDRIELYIPLK